MNSLWQDLKYGARTLLKNPGFTFVAVLTLALGIGANTAIFSVVNAVLIKALPFTEPSKLVMVWNKGAAAAGGDRTPLAVADLFDWRAQAQSFEAVGAYQNASFNYTSGESPERVRGANVTANFFSILGAQAAQGRTFLPDEDRSGAERVVIVSHRFWQKNFAGDSQVEGRAINLNGTSFTIVGVMPEAFDYPARDVELWTAMQLAQPARRGPYFLRGVARLKPDVEIQQARAEMNSMKSSLSSDTFDFNVVPINEVVVGEVRPALLLMLAAVTLVLLIAAANVANLLLVRGASREKEVAIRAALGAGRGRLIRQMLTESLLLALTGGVLGALVAVWGVDLLLKLAPQNIPRLHEIKVDLRMFGWTGLVSLATGIIFGLAPALQSSKMSLNAVLKEGGRSVTESISKKRWRSLLVISELAMSVMLLIGAGLLTNSFWRLQMVNPGVNPERVLTMQLPVQGPRYSTRAQIDTFYGQLLEQVKALPRVTEVAITNSLPPDEQPWSSDFTIEGRPVDPNVAAIANDIRISNDYFTALGIPLLRGRFFNETDSATAPPVMIINDTLAQRFFPNENPVGKRINRGSQSQPALREIVGVVGDVKYTGLAAETQPAFYEPIIQNPWWGPFLIIKSEADDPSSLTAAVRSKIASLDSELPVTQISTLDQRLSESVAQPRFRTTLIAIFAAIAMLLASVGIYGVISYSVTQRTHEIGIRVALGARAGDVFKLVIVQAMTLTLIGVLIGVIASFALTRWMESLLFGVSATDAITFTATILLLTTVASLASYIPARRAMKVDPMEALRYE